MELVIMKESLRFSIEKVYPEDIPLQLFYADVKVFFFRVDINKL